MDNTDIAVRMKEYESILRVRLIPKVPVLLRLDGKAFHTLTRNMEKPLDQRFQRCMWETAKYLCENIQGCRFAYVQSDEISLLLVDYDDVKTQGWFGYDLQKMVSVSAAQATSAFVDEYWREFDTRNMVSFDSRAWNLPVAEVQNYFIWRQQDATRNAIQTVGQSKFSHKELHGKSCAEIQEMLFQVHGVNFNDHPVPQKRGVCVMKETYTAPFPVTRTKGVDGGPDTGLAVRSRWIVDENIPVFTQDREYVEKFVRAIER